MQKLGFYINMAECIGCRTCQIACKDKNDLDVGILFRKVETFEVGEYPNARVFHYSGTCYHCEDPKCVQTCPTGAMHIAEDGTVQCDQSVCIGCQVCIVSCPYKAPVLFPDLGVVYKCDTCKDLRERGERPRCVAACPMRVLDFGDVDELKKKYEGQRLVDSLPVLPDPSTKPRLLINAKPFMQERGASPIKG